MAAINTGRRGECHSLFRAIRMTISRDCHHQCHFEIAGGKRISRHLSGTA